MEITSPKKIQQQEKWSFDKSEIKKAKLVLRAIDHKLRQAILDLIHSREEMPVTDIYIKLRLEQSVASQHLAILRKASFVKTRRDGKFVFYSVHYDNIKKAEELSRAIHALALQKKTKS